MTYLVTGAAGFIGFHISASLLARGERVIGLDNLNAYYDVALKRARLSMLEKEPGFSFEQIDVSDFDALKGSLASEPIRIIIHLAAQAGVRYSIENPHAYAQSNLVGHLNVLELARGLNSLEHLCFASSSSVYGGNAKLPFCESDSVDAPVSLYAATKKADELMSHAYSHLYRIPQTGLRFFTVYGPWGRPDMAYWLFTEAILQGKPIRVFNNGDLKRDFTYIDDVVAGVIAAADEPPADGGKEPPYRLYNIGNNHPVPLMHFIKTLEDAIGKKAEIEFLPMQPGDVLATYADIEALRSDHGYDPKTSIEEGLPEFVKWFKQYSGLV